MDHKTYKWGIKHRVLLLALLPTITISLLLGFYFIWIRVEDLNMTLYNHGEAIAARLAPAAEYGILVGNSNMLTNLARNTIEEAAASSIGFYTKSGEEIVAIGNFIAPFTLPSLTSLANHDSPVILQEYGNILSFILPISSRANDPQPELQEQEGDPILKYFNLLPEPEQIFGWIKIDMDRTATRQQVFHVLMHSGIIVLLGLSISSLLAIRMGHKVTSPILQLASFVEEIKHGNMNVNIRTNAQWEIKALESGINTMVNAIHAANSELQNNVEQATADLRHTLETIEIQNIELEIARKEAETASRVKSEFLANMSHELRTPLNGIIGFINLLLKTELTSRQKDYLTIIQKSATALLAIINDILDFSKIEAGKLTLEQTPMDIRECVEDALTLLAPSAHEKAIELVPFIYKDIPERILGDPLRLKQVLTNLVSNAIKFTESGSVVVRVMLEQDGEKEIVLCVTVTDTGIGLSEDQQKKLFNAFNQVSLDARRKFGGTGLGLVICKKLIEQMHGTINLESAPDQGATFWFTFQAQRVAMITDFKSDKKLSGMRVLLYERHSVTRLVLIHMLRDWGVRIDEIDHPDNIPNYLDTIQKSNHPFHMIIVGINQFNSQDNFVADIIFKIKKSSQCLIGIFVNTTDHFIHNEILKLGTYLSLAKPVCRKKLFDALSEIYLKDGSKEIPPTPLLDLDDPETPEIHILAVDDNSANLKLVCALLDEMGIHATPVSSGREAIEACQKQAFHLIIMDIQMPEMDGIETTRAIRKLENSENQIPIVALSAHALITRHDALIAAGLNDFLTKPISEYELRAMVYKWTQKGIGVPSLPTSSISNQKKISKYSIDLELGEMLAGGKPELAKQMLKMLIQALPDDKTKINLAYSEKNLTQLREYVHKLHGGCCYCGVPILKQIIKELEDSIASEDFQAIRRNLQKANEEIDYVLSAYQQYITNSSEQAASK